ncbi:MAG: alanine-zipper protein [Bifidobacterium mongoliense]|jgi:hypothetical protein
MDDDEKDARITRLETRVSQLEAQVQIAMSNAEQAQTAANIASMM